MIAWKFKLWRSAGAAAVLGLAACGGEGGETGTHNGAQGEAGEAAISAPTPAPAAGGESGEGGAASAYTGVAGDQRVALRIQHLRGFLKAAAREVADNGHVDVEAASILVHQGLLEVYDAAPAEFGSLDVTALREAAAGGAFTRAQMQQRLRTGEAALDAAMTNLDIDAPDLVVRLVDISTGLYQHVNQDGAVDPTEYKHSMGAALAARDTLELNQDELRRRDLGAYSRSLAELSRLVSLWPSGEPPEHPATYQQVLAQSSRVRLAMSPFL